jgi:hypothetical protein
MSVDHKPTAFGRKGSAAAHADWWLQVAGVASFGSCLMACIAKLLSRASP